jgi:nicotinamide N-methyltransferase
MTTLEELFDEGPEDSTTPPPFPVVEWQNLSIRLLNVHHSLWGDKLWEAGKIVASIIRNGEFGIDVRNRTVVEFGAGTGLPSLCCALAGAARVVATDYPDEVLVDNLRFNCARFSSLRVVGHKWGKDVVEVARANDGRPFDIALLADLVFNHTCHRQLLQSLAKCLAREGVALVTFTHHRPHLVKEDLRFFEIAEDEFGFVVEELGITTHPPMFQDDFGPLEVRSTVHVRRLRWK